MVRKGSKLFQGICIGTDLRIVDAYPGHLLLGKGVNLSIEASFCLSRTTK